MITFLFDLVLEVRFFSAIRASIACWGGVVILRGALGGLNALCIIWLNFFLTTSLLASCVLWTCESILKLPSSVINDSYSSINFSRYCLGKTVDILQFRVSCTLVSLLLTFCHPGPELLVKSKSHSLYRIVWINLSIFVLEYR